MAVRVVRNSRVQKLLQRFHSTRSIIYSIIIDKYIIVYDAFARIYFKTFWLLAM